MKIKGQTVVVEYREQLRALIAQAVGQASMCWSPRPKGVFQSSEAIPIVDDAVKGIEELNHVYAEGKDANEN